MANKNLEVAFFGSSLVSAYWNGAATYYRGIIRAMHDLGYHVTFYEPDAYNRQQHRDIEDPIWATVVVYDPTPEKVYEMLELASAADIIVKASGVGVFDMLLELEVLNLKNDKNLIVFWDVDAPATLERMEDNPTDPFRELVFQYDMVLTYGGGEPVVSAYTLFGARKCIPIYNALDTSTHSPVAPSQKYSGDLGFLGNRLPDREKRVEEFFLKPAYSLPDKQFVLGGNGWDDKKIPPNIRYVGHVYTKDHNAFNCTPKAVLNISRDSMARYGFSPATRVFEAAGAGACIITDYWRGIDLFFEPGEEIIVANSGDEVVEILNHLSVEQAHQTGQAAYKKAISAHTYDHRAKLVDGIFKEHLLDQKIFL